MHRCAHSPPRWGDRDRHDHDVIYTLAIDSLTVQVVTALRAGGLEPILLKGRSFATWLYAEGEHRFYGDCDVLVAPRQ